MNKQVVAFTLSVFMAVAAAPVFAAGGGEEAAAGDEQIVIRLGHGGSTATDLRQVAAERFKEHVERETGPAVVVEIFPDSTLGDWREMQEGLQIGTIEIVIEDIGTLERYSDMAALGFMPFVYTGRDHWERVWYSDIKDILLTTFEQETGFKLLGSMYRGARNLTAVRPVETLEDAGGLKIRVPGADSAIAGWQALGANPQAMAFPEVFGALQLNVIDAQENPLNVIFNNSLYEVAPYITMTEHVYGAHNFQLWGETFNGWPEEVQNAVVAAADEASRLYNSLLDESEAEIIAQLEARDDVTLIYPSTEEKRRWADAVRPVHDSYPRLQEFLVAVRAVM